jgi:hypothetical protein
MELYLYQIPLLSISILLVEALCERDDDVLQSRLEVLAQRSLLVNRGQQIRLIGLQVRDEVCLPLQDPVHRNDVQVSVDTGVDEGNHLVDGHGGVLLLLEELGQLLNTSC